MSAAGKPGRSEPVLLSGGPAGRSAPPSSGAALRGRLPELEAAAFAMGIDPTGPLGVWCRVQKDMLGILADVADALGSRVDERAAAVEKGMRASIERVEAEHARLKTGTEAARQLMLSIRDENINIKEERLKAGNDLAASLAEQIKDKVAEVTLIRERRWNRRQNTSMVALGFGTLFAAFMAGQLVHEHSLAAEIIARCHAHLAVDPDTKEAFCPMPLVDGMPGLPPPAAGKR